MARLNGSGITDEPLRLSEIDYDTRHKVDGGLVLKGGALERGVAYGRVFADKIKANVSRHMNDPNMPSW
jgi:isopenicillin-N N-acyltransferase-like protein